MLLSELCCKASSYKLEDSQLGPMLPKRAGNDSLSRLPFQSHLQSGCKSDSGGGEKINVKLLIRK
jgi:hypothetical protein